MRAHCHVDRSESDTWSARYGGIELLGQLRIIWKTQINLLSEFKDKLFYSFQKKKMNFFLENPDNLFLLAQIKNCYLG